jgi:hypothetical protein
MSDVKNQIERSLDEISQFHSKRPQLWLEEYDDYVNELEDILTYVSVDPVTAQSTYSNLPFVMFKSFIEFVHNTHPSMK